MATERPAHDARFEAGRHGAITDVPGVRVGHATLVRGEGPLVPGRGPVRTGVTAIIPGEDAYPRKFVAGAHVINGFGKITGLPQVCELGRLETPILLTNTFSVWTAADALVAWLCERYPEIGVTAPTVNPVVGECNDGWLNDIQGRHVRAEHVREALETASDGPVAEGAVGAGTGMVAFGWKGGVGTASRTWEEPLLGRRVTLGCLVLANFGRPSDLVIEGVSVGRLLEAGGRGEGDGEAQGGAEAGRGPQDGGAGRAADRAAAGRAAARAGQGGAAPGDGGSVVVVIATDGPLTSRQLTRLARRAEVGLARTGATHWHGSGDFALAFSTCRAYPPYLPDEGAYLNPFFEATAEAVADAVWRALFAAETVTGRDGHTARALPRERVTDLLARHGRAEDARRWIRWRRGCDAPEAAGA